MVTSAPVEVDRPDVEGEQEAAEETDRPWSTIVWNDPINLMSYVTYVFESYFGYPRTKAHKLMLDVHHRGKAVVAHGSREEMERDVSAMHSYGLWATLQRA
jgi:ATP-dependent Clp protease adaptor protein ClpS